VVQLKINKADWIFLGCWLALTVEECVRFVLSPGLDRTRTPSHYMDWWDMRVLRFLFTWVFASVGIFLVFSVARRLVVRAKA
jgi:hypothetical protein